MPSCTNICLAVTAAVIAVIYGLWTANMVNHLEFVPVDLKGKTVIVTGATEGIGKETAKVLAGWGANLILPVRSSEKGATTKEEILAEAPKANVMVVDNVDFTDLQTVRNFVKKLDGQPIDILINNAALISPVVEASVDGIERMFQVNHLAPFMLTYLLMPNLKKAPSARVVFVSSLNHYGGSVGKEKYSIERKGMQEYRPMMRYDDSKVMNVMAAISFAERFGKDNKITFNSVHPGFVVSAIDRNMPAFFAAVVLRLRKLIGRDTRQGSMAQVTVATHPKLEGVTGKFFSDGCMNSLCIDCFYCDSNGPGVKPNSDALNKESRDWLWDVSLKHTKLAASF